MDDDLCTQLRRMSRELPDKDNLEHLALRVGETGEPAAHLASDLVWALGQLTEAADGILETLDRRFCRGGA